MNIVSINTTKRRRSNECFFVADESDDEYQQIRVRNKRSAINDVSWFLPDDDTVSSSRVCATNPCEHGGRCLPKGQMKYSCKCTDDYYGEHCEKRKIDELNSMNISFNFAFVDSTRQDVLKHQSLEQLFDHIKRAAAKKGSHGNSKNDGKIYYDYLNGIYFRK